MPMVIEVIQSVVLRGDGTTASRLREVEQYHSLDGTMLAECDPGDQDESVRDRLRGALSRIMHWNEDELNAIQTVKRLAREAFHNS